MVPLAGPRCGHSVPGWMLSRGGGHSWSDFFWAKPLAFSRIFVDDHCLEDMLGEFVFVTIYE